MEQIRRTLSYIALLIFASCSGENKEVDRAVPNDQPKTCEYRSTNFYRDINPLTGSKISEIQNDKGLSFYPDSVYSLKKHSALRDSLSSEEIDIQVVHEDQLPIEFLGVDLNNEAFHYFTAIADTIELNRKCADTMFFSLDSVEKVSYEMSPLQEVPKLKRYDNAYFNIKSISQDHGLPSNAIYGISSDTKGNYWISTEQGIAWMNNNYIKSFEGLPAELTTSTFEDRHGNIWISLYGGGIVKYDGLNMFHFDKSYFHGDDRMHDLFEDRSGNIWVSRSDGASIISDSSIVHIGGEKDFIVELRSITQDDQGNIWFASVANGVTRFDGKRFFNWNKRNGFVYNDIFDIVPGGNNEVWIGTHGDGLVRFKNGQFSQLKKGLKNKTLTSLYYDRDGCLWIGTDGGGIHYIEESKIYNISTENGLSDDIVLDISEDAIGNMLLGTYGGGVSILGKPELKNFYKENGLMTNKVSSLYQDKNGKLWIGSWGAGFGYIQDQTIKWFQDDNNLAGYILSFEEDNRGNLWIGTYSEGLIKYNGVDFYHYPPEGNIPHQIIMDMDKDPDGDLWFAANSGLFKREGNQFINFLNEEEVFLDKPISDLDCRDDGSIYLASESYGVKMIQNDTVYSITEYNGLPSNNVITIQEDHSGNLWIGTQKGLVLLKDSIFYYFDEQFGLCNNVVNDINIVSDDNVWVTTSDGLSNIRYVENRYQVENYDTDDGLKNDDFFGAPIQLSSDGNSLWLGSNKGLIQFTIPQDSEKDSTTTEIRQVKVNGQRISYGTSSTITTKTAVETEYENFNHIPKSFTLDYDQNNLAFYYSVNGNFVDHKFQYRLLGFDNDWSKASAENKVDFKGLPQGSYTFQVRAYKVGGSYSLDEFQFTITPPFWLTWYAKVFYALMGVLLVLLLIRIRTYRLRKHQKFLEQKIQLATTEIRDQKNEVEKQRDVAEEQKSIVQRKNEEILDSINYSKRLQDAILPSVATIKEEFEDAFVFFKPKDIVSGDFYWMEKYEGLTMLAVADCTGHGVPGAMVSVVCANALNKVVLEMGKTDPAEILDHTRNLVIETFSKSSDDVKDGMDISLCVFNKDKSKLSWAGANNPLWIIRDGKKEVEVIKADKQPIGKYGLSKPFTTHNILINKSDQIYLFSDGYVDQFGGPKGKKLKSSKFKELLVSMSDEKMEYQKTNLEKSLSSWQGNLEQIDDICVVGVMIKS